MKLAILDCFLVCTLVAFGSLYQLTIVPYLVVGFVIVVSILVALGKITERLYPVYIYGMALALLLQITMLGFYVVGADIHGEYYLASQSIQNGWDFNLRYVNSTSIALGLLSPALAKIGIPALWQFKMVYPMIFATVPLILFFAYKKIIGSDRAFWSCLFFMVMPVFFMEISGIAKSMIAEVFLALVVLLLVVDIKPWQRITGLMVCTALAMGSHYTVGFITLGILIGMVCLMVVAVPFRWSNKMPVYYYILPLIIVAGGGLLYFMHSGSGVMMRAIKMIAGWFGQLSAYRLNTGTPLIATALGLDFMKATIGGKVFRITQYLIQFMIVVGVGYSVFRYKAYKLPTEYICASVTALCLLGLCIVMPIFAAAINASRLYHFALFLLAPMLIIGFEQIGNDIKRLRWARAST